MATTIAQIGGFELWDILQLAQTSRMSIKLSVESPHGTGSMFFEHGHLLHAVAADKLGDDAVNLMLSWREGSVSSSRLPDNTPTTVRNSSISALLLEHARKSDEAGRDAERERKRKPSQSSPARPSKPPPPPPPRRARPPKQPPIQPETPPAPEPAPQAAAPAPTADEDSPMDLQAVKSILEEIDESLMGGLLGVDIISKSTSMSIAGINSSRQACSLFNRMYENLQQAMSSKESPAKQLKKLIIEGENSVYIFVIEIDERHRWAMLIDGNKSSLGLVLSVIIPDIQPRLEDALKKYR